MRTPILTRYILITSLWLTVIAASVSGAADTDTTPVAAAVDRMAVFDTFTIRGAGGTQDIESAAAHGANTIRTWIVGDDTGALLDRAQNLGLKVILGVWMPNPDDAAKYLEPDRWRANYNKKRDEFVAQMQDLLEQYDSHPALLMWCLGNEIDLSPSFLQTINAMSEAIHRHNPARASCYVGRTTVDIDLFVEFATDIDLYGANAYGAGSMNSVSRTLTDKWRRPFFFSEYAWNGPWSVPKTASGYPVEFSPAQKVAELLQTFEVLPKYDNLVGGVFFLWGHFKNGTQTWYSGLLPRNPLADAEGDPTYLTPYTDTLHAFWTGAEVADHAPVISRASINGAEGNAIALQARQKFAVRVDATDAEGDTIDFAYWIFRTSGNKRGKLVAGPVSGGAELELTAPAARGNYTLLVYATSTTGKASSHQLPFQVD